MEPTPSFFFIATTNVAVPNEEANKDSLPSILLVLMILLLPGIAVFVGVAVWFVRRLRAFSIPIQDVESNASASHATTKHFKEKDLSGDTLLATYPHMPSPIPTIRVISKSPSRDNDSLDMDLEKFERFDYVDFHPDATSTLPRRSKSGIHEAVKDDDSEKFTIAGNENKDDPALVRAFSSFGISTPTSHGKL